MVDEQLPLSLDEQDQQQLELVAERRKVDEAEIESEKWQPGRTEFEALLFLAFRGVMGCTLACGLIGAVVGTPFYPVLGTILGFVGLAWYGFLAALFFAVNYVLLRGRISIETMMIWAAVNVGSLMFVGVLSEAWLDWNTWYLMAGGLLISAGTVGSIFGIITWIVVDKILQRYQLREGLGTRRWWQFGTFDLLIQTTWIATLALVIKSLGSMPGLGFDALGPLAICLVTSGLVTWLVRRGIDIRNASKTTATRTDS